MSFGDFARKSNQFKPSQNLGEFCRDDPNLKLATTGAIVSATGGVIWKRMKGPPEKKAAPSPPTPPSFGEKFGTAVKENPVPAVLGAAALAGSAYVVAKLTKSNKKRW